MKKIVLFAMGLVAGATAHAQDGVERTASGDFISSNIWH